MLVRNNKHVPYYSKGFHLGSFVFSPYLGCPGKEQRAMLSNRFYKPPHTSVSVTSLGPRYPMNSSGSLSARDDSFGSIGSGTSYAPAPVVIGKQGKLNLIGDYSSVYA